MDIEPGAASHIGQEEATGLFLIAQEALANVAKHAQATEVRLILEERGDHIQMQVIDNGRGFNIDEESDVLGHGLSNMQERARRVGGQLELESQSGEGTKISIRLRKYQLPEAGREKSGSSAKAEPA
jgi:signal transduction histidine kinase